MAGRRHNHPSQLPEVDCAQSWLPMVGRPLWNTPRTPYPSTLVLGAWGHGSDPPGLGYPVQSVPYKVLEEMAPLWDGCPWEMARPVLVLH